MKAIIVGIDGLLGSALGQAIRATGGEVHGTSRRPDSAARGVRHLDLANSLATEAELPAADVVFFCAAMAKFADCRANPTLARQINVLTPAGLAQRLAGRGTRVVLLSTSAVYDGRAANVAANTPPCPVTDYGRLKAEAETKFLALGKAATVVRLTKVLEPRQATFVRWIETLVRDEPIAAFSDLGLAPISLAFAIGALLAAAADLQGGIYQASANGDISYADAAGHIARSLGADPASVIAERGADRGIPAEQLTLFSSLDASRLAALTGEPAPDPYAVIDEVFATAIAQARARRMEA
jgi:dTDP-4-dehydrorhamnose reductase